MSLCLDGHVVVGRRGVTVAVPVEAEELSIQGCASGGRLHPRRYTDPKGHWNSCLNVGPSTPDSLRRGGCRSLHRLQGLLSSIVRGERSFLTFFEFPSSEYSVRRVGRCPDSPAV